MFLKIPQNSQENTCARVSFLNKFASFSLVNFGKKVLKNIGGGVLATDDFLDFSDFLAPSYSKFRYCVTYF